MYTSLTIVWAAGIAAGETASTSGIEVRTAVLP